MGVETYSKLFSSILRSSIWQEDHATVRVWVTMLALADRNGYVGASIGGLAAAARVTRKATERALAKFLAPDPDSRSQEHDGRRIETVDRGWVLLNYERFRDMRDEEARREGDRKRKQAQRQRERSAEQGGESEGVTLCHGMSREVTNNPPLIGISRSDTEAEKKEIARAGAPVLRSVDPLMNPEETPMPSGLRERALEQGNAVDHLAKTLQVPRAVIVAELEDFCRYREAGAGMGDKRAYWLKHFRQQVINRHKRGELKPPGMLQHEQRKLDNHEPVQVPRHRVFKRTDDSQVLPPTEASQAVAEALRAMGGKR